MPALPELEKRGAHVVVVGNGATEAIASFRAATGFAGALLTDPSLAVYRAAGLASGVGTVLDPRAIVNTLSALARGTRPGMPSGPSLQQGGTFVFGPGNVDRFAWRDRFNGDAAPLAGVLQSLP
ncbi:MAG: AhpC/TSA family protein [Candidatus Rokubacteria bacterium]|nr:AhpC/TSA family protein [Candidatus Rokubacteria bacterium]